MLVITRKEKQGLTLTDSETGRHVGEVFIVKVKGGGVRVGIQADSLKIDRTEKLEPQPNV